MRNCERCGRGFNTDDEVRRCIAAFNYTESSQYRLAGRLCSECWSDFLTFLEENLVQETPPCVAGGGDGA